MISVTDSSHFDELKEKEEALLVYFSHESCNVCKVLKPKVIEMVNEQFPKIAVAFSDTKKLPEIAGQNGVFTVPTILVFLDGKEYIRSSRNISVMNLEDQIRRPYEMMFS